MSKLAAAGLSSTVAWPVGRSRRADAPVARDPVGDRTASSMDPARSVRARPAARNGLSASGPLSPMSTAAVTRSATTAASVDQVDALGAAAAMSTSGAGSRAPPR